MKRLNWVVIGFLLWVTVSSWCQQAAKSLPREKVIIDTDIGDDIDDAFALALALRSPEIEILGVTTNFGDTEARARIADRLLGEAGHPEIPVAAGVAAPVKMKMNQQRYGEAGHFVKPSHPDAVTFLLEQIRQHPGEIALIAIGPLMNIGAAIDKDPATFRKLRRVVLMGGSVRRGYGDLGYTPPHGPDPEWNILNDIPSAEAVHVGSADRDDASRLDATETRRGETRLPVQPGHAAHRRFEHPLLHVGTADADAV